MKKLNLLNLKDVRSKKTDELEKNVAELNEQLNQLNHEIASGQSKDTHNLKNIKRQIARIKTVIGQKKAEEK